MGVDEKCLYSEEGNGRIEQCGRAETSRLGRQVRQGANVVNHPGGGNGFFRACAQVLHFDSSCCNLILPKDDQEWNASLKSILQLYVDLGILLLNNLSLQGWSESCDGNPSPLDRLTGTPACLNCARTRIRCLIIKSAFLPFAMAQIRTSVAVGRVFSISALVCSFASRIAKIRSTPTLNPMHSTSSPPNCLTSPSYRPPPAMEPTLIPDLSRNII